MPSRRMHTARLLPISPSLLACTAPRGCTYPVGVPALGVYLPWWGEYLPWHGGVPAPGVYLGMYLPGGVLARGLSARGTCLGGVPGQGCILGGPWPGVVPAREYLARGCTFAAVYLPRNSPCEQND